MRQQLFDPFAQGSVIAAALGNHCCARHRFEDAKGFLDNRQCARIIGHCCLLSSLLEKANRIDRMNPSSPVKEQRSGRVQPLPFSGVYQDRHWQSFSA